MDANGFAVVPTLYTPWEVTQLLTCVESAISSGPAFSCPKEVFAIRGLFAEIPDLWPLLAKSELHELLAEVFPDGCHVVKAMYFDKPSMVNWRVAWHQDLMINVNRRDIYPGFGPWTNKPEGVSVQPPLEVLENICTIRIHLDPCDEKNGALNAVPGSHRMGVLQAADLPALTPNAVACPVPAGGAMLMRPLLLHASYKNTSERPRRVLHIEFASVELPGGLLWRERMPVMALARRGGSTGNAVEKAADKIAN